jgi:hypothetical protein
MWPQAVQPQVFALTPVGSYQHRLVLDLYPTHPADPLESWIAERTQHNDALSDWLSKQDPVAQSSKPNTTATSPASSPSPSLTPPTSPSAQAAITDRLIVVAIDAGHGGEDPGAIGPNGTKEKDVVDRIMRAFPDFTWISDKKVKDGCSKRRPDLLLDMGSHIIIIEVDEYQHTDYDTSCENKRLMELSNDLQHRPIVFIRFNPDDYVNKDGIIVKSCWKINKSGIMQITSSKQKEWEVRIDTLKRQIQYCIDNPIEKTIQVIELFYS